MSWLKDSQNEARETTGRELLLFFRDSFYLQRRGGLLKPPQLDDTECLGNYRRNAPTGTIKPPLFEKGTVQLWQAAFHIVYLCNSA